MVLSTGTLNLKFMQRAAARNAQTPTPNQTTSTSTPASNATQSSGPPATPTAGPSRLNQSTSTDTSSPAQLGTETPQVLTSEQWFLPRSSTKPPSTSSTKHSAASSRWTFEQSYMPFLSGPASTDEGLQEIRGPSGNSKSGGGRMTFGFGEEPKDTDEQPAEGGGQDEEEGVDGERKLLEEIRADDTDIHIARPLLSGANGKGKGKRGFIRPEGFDSPLKRAPKETKSSIKSTSTTRTPSTPLLVDGGNEAGPSTLTAVVSDKKGKKRKNPPTPSNEEPTSAPVVPTPSLSSVFASEVGNRKSTGKQVEKAKTLDERENEGKEAKRRLKKEAKRRKKQEQAGQGKAGTGGVENEEDD